MDVEKNKLNNFSCYPLSEILVIKKLEITGIIHQLKQKDVINIFNWWVNLLSWYSITWKRTKKQLKWVRAGCTQTASCHEVKSRNEKIREWRVPGLLTAFKDDVFALLLSCRWLFILVCLLLLAASCFVQMTGFETLLSLCLITGVWSQWWIILFCCIYPYTVSSLLFCLDVPPPPIQFIWQCSSPWKSNVLSALFYLYCC